MVIVILVIVRELPISVSAGEESASKQRPMRRAAEPHAPNYVSDEYLSSVDWLKRYGINARRLNFYEFLKHLIFKHADGVIEKCYAPIERKRPALQPLEALELTGDDVDDDKTVRLASHQNLLLCACA